MDFSIKNVIIDKDVLKSMKFESDMEFYFADDLFSLRFHVTRENSSNKGVIIDVSQLDSDPCAFLLKLSNGIIVWASMIYPNTNNKKEVCIRPFRDYKELILKWERVCPSSNKSPPNTMPLIWVKYKLSDNCQLITTFNKDGVEMGAEYMSWKALFDRMTFLDGSPCGIADEGFVH